VLKTSKSTWWLGLLLLLASLLYCRAFLEPFLRDGDWTAGYKPTSFIAGEYWGEPDHLLMTGHDWDMHYFFQAAVQRSVYHDGQWPFWNPWNLGGFSLWGDPQMQFPTPFWLVNVFVGPIGGVRLQVVLHHWIGLLATWWLAGLLGLSRRAALLAACAFMMSTWYSLHLAVGHAQIWSAAYIPFAIGCLWRARTNLRWVLGAAMSLALVIFEGGTYVYLVFFWLLASLTVAWALANRSFRPVLALGAALILSAGLAAVRLAPEVALIARYPRTLAPVRASYDRLARDLDTPPPGPESAASAVPTSAEPGSPSGVRAVVAQLAGIFLARGHEPNGRYYRYQGYAWHEYGAYIGPVVLGLLLFAPVVLWHQPRSLWPWLSGAMVCFAVAVGNFASFSPWALLHDLPFYSQTRVPSRFLIPFVLAAAMIAGATYDALRRQWATGPSRAVLLDIGLLLACVDLLVVGGRGFRNEEEHTRVRLRPPVETPVTVLAGNQEQTALLMAGYRAANGDDPIPVASFATALGQPGYVGEVFLEASDPDEDRSPALVGLEQWSPGRITLQMPEADGWAVLNMNWAPGWRSQPSGLVTSRGGRLAVSTRSGASRVVLYYVPELLQLGITVSLGTLLAAVLWWWVMNPATAPRRSLRAGREPISR
jgi:hypothetical protein